MPSPWAASQGQQLGGMQDLDLTMFQNDLHHHYVDPASNHTGQLMHPSNYHHGTAWHADREVETHSAAGLLHDFSGSYQQSHPTPQSQPSQYHAFNSAAAQSSEDSRGSESPQQPQGQSVKAGRPPLSRRITAPEPRQRSATLSTTEVPLLKRSGSDDGDDDYIPNEDAKIRGRKRQRIPHTAVERRYRENLNAHLDRLRQTIPSLATRGGQAKSGDTAVDGGGVKPSKCEILNGAIEHIGALDKENQALKIQISLLTGRMKELERYHNSDTRAPYSN